MMGRFALFAELLLLTPSRVSKPVQRDISAVDRADVVRSIAAVGLSFFVLPGAGKCDQPKDRSSVEGLTKALQEVGESCRGEEVIISHQTG